ncbi:unnamed protein product [Protopolystoma xenopodis]|uniref:Uncharacterized protein n=1 Tax=Protopolystoma xenopodis TaxID=117903 RepID=A0A448WFD0_9PLAT|nr:unnamed protein product [Protopolystoma xenopodis]
MWLCLGSLLVTLSVCLKGEALIELKLLDGHFPHLLKSVDAESKDQSDCLSVDTKIAKCREVPGMEDRAEAQPKASAEVANRSEIHAAIAQPGSVQELLELYQPEMASSTGPDEEGRMARLKMDFERLLQDTKALIVSQHLVGTKRNWVSMNLLK